MGHNSSNIQASLLDRLVDDEPGITHEPVQYRLVSIKQIKNSVIRDLENLLNTRRYILIPSAALKNLNNSLFVYGLKDFTAENPNSPFVRQRLRQDIAKTIMRFEPRLRNVTVHFETKSSAERNLRFRISGLLVLEFEKEPVVFDTYFDVNRGEYFISK